MINDEQAESMRQALNPAPAPVVEAAAVKADVAIETHPQVEVVRERPSINASDLPSGYTIDQLLRIGFDADASDVHIGVSAPPLMRRHGPAVVRLDFRRRLSGEKPLISR